MKTFGFDKANGACRILGLHLAQRPEVVWHFTQFINKVAVEEGYFNRIIELGTGSGGLTTLLSLMNIYENIDIYTFDIEDYVSDVTKKLWQVLQVTFTQTDILYGNDTVSNLLSELGKVLLLCDNGDKRIEFNTYAPYLKSGDYIMAHDYFHTELKSDIWSSCGISYEDIKDTIVECNLKYYMQDMWHQSAWVCMRKQ